MGKPRTFAELVAAAEHIMRTQEQYHEEGAEPPTVAMTTFLASATAVDQLDPSAEQIADFFSQATSFAGPIPDHLTPPPEVFMREHLAYLVCSVLDEKSELVKLQEQRRQQR